MKYYRAVTALTVAGLIFGISAVCAAPKASEPAGPQTADLARVFMLSITKLQSVTKSPADYKLIKVEMTWAKGKYVWRATYKPARLLPNDPSKEAVGAGGEIFIDIDLTADKAEVKYGE